MADEVKEINSGNIRRSVGILNWNREVPLDFMVNGEIKLTVRATQTFSLGHVVSY